MMKDFTISNMLDLNETIAAELFEGKTYPWEVLPEIGDFIIKLGKTLDPSEYEKNAVLGYKSHMGAGSICSNVKSDKKLVVVKDGDEKIETGLKKFGAMLGDHVEVGCGSVLNPGTVIGRNSNIYPLSPVRGCVPADSIYKNAKEIVKKK